MSENASQPLPLSERFPSVAQDYSAILVSNDTGATAQWMINNLDGRRFGGEENKDAVHQWLWILSGDKIKLSQATEECPKHCRLTHLALRVSTQEEMEKMIKYLEDEEGFVPTGWFGNSSTSDWYLLKAPSSLGSFYLHLAYRSLCPTDPRLSV